LQPFQAKRSADEIFPTWNYFVAGISHTRSRPFRCRDFPHSEDCLGVPLMGFSPTRNYSAAGIPPLGVGPSTAGISPTQRTYCTLQLGFFLLGDSNADLLIGPFSISIRESKPSTVEFLPLGVPTLLQGFPLQSPCLMLR